LSTFLQLHPSDNVAIAIAELRQHSTLQTDKGPVTVAGHIPMMHKVATTAIRAGAMIIKYGQPIGTALVDIEAGTHVHTHNCDASIAVKDYGFCANVKPTHWVDDAHRATFMGFRRANGKVGTRNYIGILTSVNCSATVASHIAAQFSYPGALADFPNVDGVVALTHESGCGMRTSGEAYELLERTLVGYANHPNFGGVLLIGLGCESMQVQRLLQDNGLADTPSFKAFTIQESGGTRASITKGIESIREMLPLVNSHTRSAVPASELTLAVQCGGSDAFSGITANPALGAACDILVRHGGTVIYSETPEIYGAEHLLTQRSETPAVAEKLLERIRWWENYTSIHGFELNNNPSPGNKSGGLTTIVEKSLGAQAKAGTTNLRAVYLYAEPVKEKGLVFMDSPGFDPVSVTGQVASGANVICFTTGRGSAFGFKPVPSLKLASNNELYAKMRDDIDINCGEIISGDLSVEQCGQRIFERILATASGEKTVSEELGYGHNEFNPWKLGATV
jgi:altronate hydrolase